MPQTPRPVYKVPTQWWKGIAIAGIWIGVGLSTFADPMVALGLGIMAGVVTICIIGKAPK